MSLVVVFSIAKIVGIILFLIVTVLGVYWLVSFYRSLSNDMPAGMSRRQPISLDDLPVSTQASTNPVITPVNEVKIERSVPKIPDRLPQVILPAPPSQPSERKVEVAANFQADSSSVEESLLFRILAQAMFILSVIGFDVAAGTHYSLVTVPFTSIGAAWSYHRRHHAKHWLNLVVSIASWVILFGVIAPILVIDIKNAFERIAPAVKTPVMMALVLGFLLICIEMLLCFHLYSRRMLGYVLVISGVLIAVTAVLMPNLSFPILLCGFLAISIPALMLDYRSRISLQPVGVSAIPDRTQLPHQHLPWKYLAQLTVIAFILGLIISVFLPNFHLPELSFQPTGLDRLQNLAQKYRSPQTPQQSPSPGSPSNISQLPQMDVQAMASKLLGQPGNNNYPDSIKQENLQLSPEIASQLQQFAQSILATSPQPLDSDFDRAAYLAEYLKQHYKADPAPANPASLPPVDAKLIEQLIAQCQSDPKNCSLSGNKQDEQILYNSMLRSIGIPARLKTGDKIAQIDPNTKMYARLPEQPQSKTEVYFPNWGWLGLDSTPDRPLFDLDPRQMAQLQQQLQALSLSMQSSTATPSPSTPTPQSSPNNSSINHPNTNNTNNPNPNHPFNSSSPANSFNPNSSTPSQPFELPKWEPDPVLIRILIGTIAICGALAWYLSRQQKQQQQAAKLPPVEQIYRSMLATVSKEQRIYKRGSQTQLEYADNVSKLSHHQIAKVVREISELYTAWRYGKQPVNISQLSKKLQYLQQLQQLAAQKQRQQKVAKFKSQWGLGK